jgi:hypothetical protein
MRQAVHSSCSAACLARSSRSCARSAHAVAACPLLCSSPSQPHLLLHILLPRRQRLQRHMLAQLRGADGDGVLHLEKLLAQQAPAACCRLRVCDVAHPPAHHAVRLQRRV